MANIQTINDANENLHQIEAVVTGWTPTIDNLDASRPTQNSIRRHLLAMLDHLDWVSTPAHAESPQENNDGQDVDGREVCFFYFGLLIFPS